MEPIYSNPEAYPFHGITENLNKPPRTRGPITTNIQVKQENEQSSSIAQPIKPTKPFKSRPIIKDVSIEKDPNKLTLGQLWEALERQRNLKKSMLDKLPDKGKRLIQYREKLEEIIKSREMVEETANLLSNLSVAEKIDCKHPLASGVWRLNRFSRRSKSDDDEPEEMAITMATDEPSKGILKKKYSGSALEFLPEPKPIQMLSMEDSLKLESETTAKTNFLVEKRKIELLIDLVERRENHDLDDDDTGERAYDGCGINWEGVD